VITNHTKHVTHGREARVEPEELLTYIGYASIIGSQASILAGTYIGPQSIVGGGSVVVRDLEGRAVYVGNPCRRKSDLPPGYSVLEPEDAGSMYLTEEILCHVKKYNRYLRIKDRSSH
jgi:serine acetyltransferase